MTSPFNSKSNRSRFRSSSIPISTKYASAFSSGSEIRSMHESGAGKALRSTDGNAIPHRGSAHSSTSTATTGINYKAFSPSTIPVDETVPSENRTDCGSPSSSNVFIFEAKDSDDNNKNDNTDNNRSNDNGAASRTRAIKSGRRSGKVPAQPTLFANDSFQPFDDRCNSWKNQCSDFDRFLFEQLESSAWQDAHEDVQRQLHNWDPFQAQTAADDDSATNNNNKHYSNAPSSPGIGDSVFNPRTNEVEVAERNVPDTMAGTGGGGGAELNSNENFSDNLAGHEHCEPEEREMGDFYSTDHEAFVFTASKPKPSVVARGVQEFRSSNCFGEFEAARGPCHGLKNNRGRGSDNVFAAEGPIIGSRFVASVDRSAGESTDSGPIRMRNENSLFKPGHENQLNLHQSIGREDNVKELTAADANFHIGIDQQINAEHHFHQGESPTGGEHQCRWSSTDEGGCGIPTGSNKWKLLFEERTSAASSENDWLNATFGKLRTDEFENGNNTTTAKFDASTQRRRFASAASSRLSSSASGPVRRSHRPTAKFKKSDKKLESSFGMQPFGLQTETGQGHVSGRKGQLSDHTIEKEKIPTEASCRFFDPLPVTGSVSLLPDQRAESRLPTSPVPVKSAISEQVCEKWRLRGNQAYANGDFPKAEEYYSCGVSCISPSEKSKSCVRARMLCYSNRAAARMAVGKMREALTDCMHAMDIDSKFVRARIRAASCHLALGECDAALKLFKECMGSGDEPETLGVKITTEALDGIRNAEQMEENMNEAVKLLNAGKSEGASNALCLVNEALSISPHCENLLELKARALLSLCNYGEVIQVCKESMVSVELNHKCGNCISENPVGNKGTSPSQHYCHIKLQFWQMTGKAHFYLGKLDQALNSLLKYEEANSAAGRSGGESMESLAPLVATINDLLYHKAAGNEAFQVGKYAEAVEHYTAALACNNESRPFTAVCFCNRAAASHGLGHIADGIADCSRAIAFDSEYPKAFSRRAILHEMVRNYGQAINDLQRLITLLERQEQQAKESKSRRFGSLGNNTQDLKEARERLAKAEEDLKKGNPLDHYLILGVEPSCTAAEIKKAYRKAALKHHPDKAGQFLVRSDSGDDALLKEFGDEFRRDAEKLFKMIGEAYAVISEPSKRLRYDTEEELRKLRTEGSTSGAETVSEPNCYQYEKDSRCHREGWDSWNDCKNQYQHWQSGPGTSQPDTYARQGSNNSRSSDGFRWNDYDWDDI